MMISDIFESGKRVLLLFVIFVSALVLVSVILNFIGTFYYDSEIGFVQELSFFGLKVGQEVSGDHFFPRYFSLTPNPNTFSGFVFVSIVSCFYLRKIGYIGKALHFLLLLMLVLGLLMAQSKASIIASILGVIVFGFMVSGRKLEFVLGSIISVLVVSVISMLLFVSDFQGAGFLDNDRLASGLSGRDELWGFAASIVNDNLIFGGGYGVSDLLLARYGSWNLSSHNALLSIMMETGIVGLVIFICMVTFSLVVNIHLWAKLRNTDLGIYYVFLVSMIISILAYQMVESSLFKLSFMNYAFLYFVFSGLRASD